MNASVDDTREFVAESQQAALSMAESFFRTSADQLEYWVVPPSTHVSGLGERVLLIAALKSDRPRPEPRREERRPERERAPREDRPARDDRPPREAREREPRREGRDGRERGGRGESRREREREPERETPRAAREESPEPAPGGPPGKVGTFVAGLLERMKLADVGVTEAEREGVTVVTLAGRAITQIAEREPRLLSALSHLAHRAAEALIGENATAEVEVRGMRRPERDDSRERGGRDGRRGPRRDDRRDDRGRRGGRDSDDRDIDEAELERLARTVARSVRESGEAELLPPMNSRERWFVHNALKDERGVRSESEGEGARKRIKILPA